MKKMIFMALVVCGLMACSGSGGSSSPPEVSQSIPLVISNLTPSELTSNISLVTALSDTGLPTPPQMKTLNVDVSGVPFSLDENGNKVYSVHWQLDFWYEGGNNLNHFLTDSGSIISSVSPTTISIPFDSTILLYYLAGNMQIPSGLFYYGELEGEFGVYNLYITTPQAGNTLTSNTISSGWNINP